VLSPNASINDINEKIFILKFFNRFVNYLSAFVGVLPSLVLSPTKKKTKKNSRNFYALCELSLRLIIL
jgi:hypothetical protein